MEDNSGRKVLAVVNSVHSVSRNEKETFQAIAFHPDLKANPGKYPLIHYAHGFKVIPSISCFFVSQLLGRYSNVLKSIARCGIIVVATESQLGLGTNFFPSHSQYADDIITTIQWILSQNTNRDSIFYESIESERIGLLGTLHTENNSIRSFHGWRMHSSCFCKDWYNFYSTWFTETDIPISLTLVLAPMETWGVSAKKMVPEIKSPLVFMYGSVDKIVPGFPALMKL